MKYKIVFITIIILIFPFILYKISSIGNPVAVYCEKLGYKYVTVYNSTTGSYEGYCCVDNKTCFEGYNFYYGVVGAEYSACAKFGYNYIFENDTLFCIVNGTKVYPFELVGDLAVGGTFLSNNTFNKTNETCNSILDCPNTPWLVPSCSRINYPCFNPPHILPGYNESQLKSICDNTSKSWYKNPYGVNLTQQYLEAKEKCNGTLEVTCFGEFICHNETTMREGSLVANINISKENLVENKTKHNILLLLGLLVSFIVVGIIIYKYIIRKE